MLNDSVPVAVMLLRYLLSYNPDRVDHLPAGVCPCNRIAILSLPVLRKGEIQVQESRRRGSRP